MFDSAQEMKSELDAKSGFQKYLRSRDYYKVTNGVYEHVKVAYTCDLSYHISYFSLRSLYRIELVAEPSSSPHRVHHRKLVGFALYSQYT